MQERKSKKEKKVENIENQLCEEKHTNLESKTCKNIDEVSANDIIKGKTINLKSSKREVVDNKFNDIKENYKDIQEKQSKNDLQIDSAKKLFYIYKLGRKNMI